MHNLTHTLFAALIDRVNHRFLTAAWQWRMAACRNQPRAFANDVLGSRWWFRQEEIARQLVQHRRVAVRRANGVVLTLGAACSGPLGRGRDQISKRSIPRDTDPTAEGASGNATRVYFLGGSSEHRANQSRNKRRDESLCGGGGNAVVEAVNARRLSAVPYV
jgi:hypothetical protein